MKTMLRGPYTLEVDYRLSREERLANLKVYSAWRLEPYQICQEERSERVETYLLNVTVDSKNTTTDEIRQTITDAGYRPATFDEMLAFGATEDIARRPDEEIFLVICLDQVYTNYSDYFPVIFYHPNPFGPPPRIMGGEMMYLTPENCHRRHFLVVKK